MITGHNTDVRYGDVVLHVQTEDKGQGNPCIESLIYYGGQVVVAKRGNYTELLEEGKGDNEIMALMDHQHRTMIKAIQAGKFDEKIQAFLPDKTSLPQHDERPSFDLSADSTRTLDQVILEYLTSEAEQEQLVLMMEEDIEIKAGSDVDLTLRARSSKTGQAIGGASVNVKMISTFGGPQTLGVGQTNKDGTVHIPVTIPSVDRGTAALIITAQSAIGQQELKQLL
ncbi:MAG: hypothetical protein MPN21_22530 [Thermoanaerobaculia bacterium]|nr:hypothetical protein [Thermoanaerobaculia bacterium]